MALTPTPIPFNYPVESSNNSLVDDTETRLVHYLFYDSDYKPSTRPVANLNDTIQVNFVLSLSSIINVDEKAQVLKLNLWLRFIWNDINLIWDRRRFVVDTLRVPADFIWRPDIVLFNNADGNYAVSWESKVVISSTGTVIWIPPALFSSSCVINVKYFPFDEQSCELKFGSWTYNSNEVILVWFEGQTQADQSDYYESDTWRIISCEGKIVNITRPNRPPQTQIIYTVILRRRTLFYTVNLIMPCVLIGALTVCVFYLPTNAPAKVTLAINVLLAMVFFLLLLSKLLPPTDIIPLISRFLLFTFCLNMVSIVSTIVIINISARSPRSHHLPDWMKTVFIYSLPRILMMHQPSYVREERAADKAKLIKSVLSKCLRGEDANLSFSNDHLQTSQTVSHVAENSFSQTSPTNQSKQKISTNINLKENSLQCDKRDSRASNGSDVSSLPASSKSNASLSKINKSLFQKYPIFRDKLEDMQSSFHAIRYIAARIESEDAYSGVSISYKDIL